MSVTRLGLHGSIATPYGFEAGTEPRAFSFTNQSGIALSTLAVTSNTVILTGIATTVPITISGDTGYGYSLNGGAFVTTAGNASNGATLAVRVDASANYNAGTQVTIVVGDLTVQFIVTTLREPAVVTALASRRRLHNRR